MRQISNEKTLIKIFFKAPGNVHTIAHLDSRDMPMLHQERRLLKAVNKTVEMTMKFGLLQKQRPQYTCEYMQPCKLEKKRKFMEASVQTFMLLTMTHVCNKHING